MASAQRTETTRPDGGNEARVTTVDHRSLPGGGQETKTTESVQVIHEVHPRPGSGTLAGASEAVANAIQAAKSAVSGNNNNASDDQSSK